MIGNRALTIQRAAESGARDAEGRRVAGTWATVATVRGNLFAKQAAASTADGQLLVLWNVKALVPAGTDVRTTDRITADGETYRVLTVTARRGPDGAVHHLSVECERED